MKNLIKVICIAVSIFLGASGYAIGGERNDKGTVVELTSETFQTTICDITKDDAEFLGSKPAIVDFTATWCGSCKRLAPILEEIAKEYKGKVNVYKVDVDKCGDLAKAFKISSIPAVMFIPMEGTPVMTVGLRDKAEIKKQIEQYLSVKEK